MTPPEIIDFETAKTQPGVRMVVPAEVPSPWSEAAKHMFHLGGVPTSWVHPRRRDPEFAAWTGAHNQPVVFHDKEPSRTHWADITELACRLSDRPLVPADATQRIRTFGLLHEIAGEGGMGWSGRLLMIDASMGSEGAIGFPAPVAGYLAPKYGYSRDCAPAARARINEVLGLLLAEFEASPGDYLAGATPGALDAYVAAFLSPVVGLSEDECPAMHPALRHAFTTMRNDSELQVPAPLLALRERLFAQHLPFPIQL